MTAPQDPGVCSYTGGSCTATSPCPTQMGTARRRTPRAVPRFACASVGYCKYGTNVLCTNPAATVPTSVPVRPKAARPCQAASTCPLVTSGGTCSQGSTPRGGCSQTSDCPSNMLCQVSGDSCGLATGQPPASCIRATSVTGTPLTGHQPTISSSATTAIPATATTSA